MVSPQQLALVTICGSLYAFDGSVNFALLVNPERYRQIPNSSSKSKFDG